MFYIDYLLLISAADPFFQKYTDTQFTRNCYTLEPLYKGTLNSGYLSITYICCCPGQMAI